MCASQRPHAARGDEVRQIKEVIDIVDVISPYTNLVPSGKRMKGLSPFTNEKTPSFYVDPEDGVYYCFSSQKGGDIFSFVQEVEGVDFKGALAILAQQAGIELGNHPTRRRNDTDSLYDILASTASLYQELLTDDVRSYLTGRGISEASITAWGIGFAPDSWRTVTENRTKKELEQYVKAGLCVQRRGRHFDFFRGRVLFPFHDNNRIIGFSGRAYGEKETAKYINSPETMQPPLFNKSTFLYGLHRAKQEIRRQSVVVLTEGPVDAILMHQAGYPMTVATSGTAVTTEHLETMQRLSGGRLILALDGDGAGKRATLRVIEMAITIGVDATNIKVVVLPDGKDPADMIAADPEEFRTRFRGAKSVASFVTDCIDTQVASGDTADRVRGVLTQFAPLIAKVQNPVTRDHLQKEAASFCGVSDTAVAEMVEQLRSDIQNTPAPVCQTPAASKHQLGKIDKHLRIVASAQAFLGTTGSVEKDQKDALRTICAVWGLPSVSRSEAVVKYEEGMPDLSKQDRAARVQEDLRKSISTLFQEARKRQEVKKSRAPAV